MFRKKQGNVYLENKNPDIDKKLLIDLLTIYLMIYSHLQQLKQQTFKNFIEKLN